MNAPNLLDKHIGLCIAHARGWLDPVLRAAHARLLTPNHPSVQGAPRPVVAAAVEFLQLRGSALADAFERELGRQLRDDVAPARHAAADEPGLAEWTLVDEDAAAEEVEVVRTIQLVEGGAEWELRELQARTATLRGQSAVAARSNPLRPEVVARSLWAAAQSLGLDGAARRVLLRAASDPLTPAMQQACRDAIGWLTQWGVQPAAWKVTSVASGRLPAPPSSGFDVTRPGALDELRAAVSGTGPLARGGAGSGGSYSAASGASHGLSHGAAAGGHAAARAASDQATQALLAALFDRMLGDACLAAPVLARVGRLQPVVLRVALTGVDAEGSPVELEKTALSLTVMSQSSVEALAPDSLVARRVCELSASKALLEMRQAASRGNWILVEELLAQSMEQFAGNDWVKSVLESMQGIAQRRQLQRLRKEAMYSASAMNLRLSAHDEAALYSQAVESQSGPSFLRRKSSQGKGH